MNQANRILKSCSTLQYAAGQTYIGRPPEYSNAAGPYDPPNWVKTAKGIPFVKVRKSQP